MAVADSKSLSTQFVGFSNLNALRQLGLLIALAASVAAGVWIVMWSTTPNMAMLYSGLSEKDTGLVIDALEKTSVRYQLGGTGTVLVPSSDVHDIRMKLAAQGLPQGTAVGFESLGEDQGFGVSQFMENARYQRSLEVELSRSVSALANVNTARVHLAIPKQSVFLRDKKKPSASVIVSLYSGRSLEEEQVMAISHIVSSSVPNLTTGNVTVVDQSGRLLTTNDHSRTMALSASQLNYTRKLEKNFMRRIEGILSPIVGPGSVSAQVAADVDFTFTEQTQESFNPDTPALRSSQSVEEKSSSSNTAQGVPGAASNQPGEANATDGGGAGNFNQQNNNPSNNRRRSVKNYELDKTISHTRLGMGRIKRLSVAVVIDDKKVVSSDGVVTKAAYSPEELSRFTQLVKESVGYNLQRGDSVNIINAAFSVPLEPEALPEEEIWKQGWFIDVVKNVIGGLLGLILLFGVLRPVMRSLAQIGKDGPNYPVATALPAGAAAGAQAAPQQLAAPANDNVKVVQTAAEQDPKLVAQVVKTWVGNE